MRILALCVLAACSSPASVPATTATEPAPAPPAPVTADAREASEDEKLAAIQKAMNDLDEGVQACWAAIAARERFDIGGTLKAQIEIFDTGGSAKLVEDTTRHAGLASCVVTLLNSYRWAPPLVGQTIQLPFKVTPPTSGQNVIDRALVPWVGQTNVSVAVLLDAANSGNDDLSLFEVAFKAGSATGMRGADRDEVWYFLGAADIAAVARGGGAVKADDMAYVPAGGARDIRATHGDVHAIVALTPGGREGSGRAGALPTQQVVAKAAPVGATIVAASAAKTFGPATIYIDATTRKDTPVAASVLTLAAGTVLPVHVHAMETEALYILEGSGTLTVDGVTLPITPTSVVQVPPNTKHTVTATTSIRALQFYTPAGPEQRFKKP